MKPYLFYSKAMKPRTLLRYHGGKWMLAPWIISHFPDHRIYVEPFGGGWSVLLRKPRSYAEVYNDLDGEIVNVFKMVREKGNELADLLYLTPYAREEYGVLKVNDDPMERARKTIIRSFMGFSSTSIHRNTGFRSDSNRSGTTPAHDWKNYPESLVHTIDRLRGVVIENRDAKVVIQFTKEWSFIKEWWSLINVKREIWINSTDIWKCCRWKIKSAGWFLWKYKYSINSPTWAKPH